MRDEWYRQQVSLVGQTVAHYRILSGLSAGGMGVVYEAEDVRLGSPRAANEGLRIGTVRRAPRGVPKAEYTTRDLFDVWLPELAPSETIPKEALTVTDDTSWRRFVRRYRIEMKAPQARHALDLLAALSHRTNLSVGCYCERSERCHRSLLEELLAARGAKLVP